MKTETITQKCSNSGIKYIQDALEVLNGSWKLPILASLSEGTKRFKEIAKDVDGISDKMLSKELRSLEMNRLVKRTVYDTFPPAVEYSVTEHTATLRDVLNALSNWGFTHRQKIIGKAYAK
ncbi:MAG: helix-turn-helix domain-containing protein [Segetibacter sp.]